ncbi:MAG: hypothetical protein QM817_26265 [Archangium sp.]
MRIALPTLLLALSTGCTAGGVAVQGQGFLIPAEGYTVGWFSVADCKSFVTTTGSTGQFAFDGSNDVDQLIMPGEVCVTVRLGNGPKKYYVFDHAFDTTCTNGNGKEVSCSKDLFMLTGSYDELSANAPGPEVHVRFPHTGGFGDPCAAKKIICNIK